MSIEQEALNMIESFIVGIRPTMKYSSAPKKPPAAANDRRAYRTKVDDDRTPADDLYEAIVKIKNEKFPSGMSDVGKEELAEDIKVFQIIPLDTGLDGVKTFMLSKKKEYQLEAAKKKEARKADKAA